MQHIPEILFLLPPVLQALSENPLGAVVLVALAALAFAAYVLHKLK